MKEPIVFFNEPGDGGDAPVARPAIRFFDEPENGGNVPAARPAIRFFDEPGDVSDNETEKASYAKFTVIKDEAVIEHPFGGDRGYSEVESVAEPQQQPWLNWPLSEKSQETLIDMCCAVEKTKLLNQEDLEKEERRAELREEISERREESKRSRYQDIIVTTDGEILAQTRNLNISASSRAVFNFSSPCLYWLVSTNGETGYYRLDFLLDGATAKSFTFLKADRCGQPKYILGKILRAGGNTLTDNVNHRLDYVAKLWTVLLRTCKALIVPDKHGWVYMGGKYSFIGKGELIWKDIMTYGM